MRCIYWEVMGISKFDIIISLAAFPLTHWFEWLPFHPYYYKLLLTILYTQYSQEAARATRGESAISRRTRQHLWLPKQQSLAKSRPTGSATSNKTPSSRWSNALTISLISEETSAATTTRRDSIHPSKYTSELINRNILPPEDFARKIFSKISSGRIKSSGQSQFITYSGAKVSGGCGRWHYLERLKNFQSN